MAKQSSDNSPWKPSKSKTQQQANTPKLAPAPKLSDPVVKNVGESLEDVLSKLNEAIVSGQIDSATDLSDTLNKMQLSPVSEGTQAPQTQPELLEPQTIRYNQPDQDSQPNQEQFNPFMVDLPLLEAGEVSFGDVTPLDLRVEQPQDRRERFEEAKAVSEAEGMSAGEAPNVLQEAAEGQRDMTPRERREAAEQRKVEREAQQEADAEEADRLNMTVGDLKRMRDRQADEPGPEEPSRPVQDQVEQAQAGPVVQQDEDQGVFARLNAAIDEALKPARKEEEGTSANDAPDNEKQFNQKSENDQSDDPMQNVVALLTVIAADLAEIKAKFVDGVGAQGGSENEEYHG